MRSSLWGGAVLLLAALAVSGCAQDDPTSATGPTTLAPFLESGLPELGGIWSGPLLLTSVTGGAGAVADAGAATCVGAAFEARVLSDNISSLVLEQDGRSVTGRLTSAETGLAGAYSGATGATQLVLNAESFDAGSLNVLCPTGETATLEFVGSSLIAEFASVSAPSMLTGTVAHTFNVFTKENDVQEGLVTQFSFTMERR